VPSLIASFTSAPAWPIRNHFLAGGEAGAGQVRELAIGHAAGERRADLQRLQGKCAGILNPLGHFIGCAHPSLRSAEVISSAETSCAI
jgi:hypothetical protein